MAEPHEPTWTTLTHTWCEDSNMLIVCVGPRVSGPRERMGGRTWPIGRRKGLLPFSLIYLINLLYFLHVGLTSLSKFSRGVAARGALEEIALIDARRSRGLRSTQSQSKHVLNCELPIV